MTPAVISPFIVEHIEEDGWAPKMAKLMRLIPHRLSAQAIGHRDLVSWDRLRPNPAAAVESSKVPTAQILFLCLRQIDEHHIT